jgi:superfamily II DNA helicase RecQ
MTRQEAQTILQKTFKFPKFYDEQWESMEKILKGERVLLIEKTGFGKSLFVKVQSINQHKLKGQAPTQNTLFASTKKTPANK